MEEINAFIDTPGYETPTLIVVEFDAGVSCINVSGGDTDDSYGPLL